MAVRFGAWLVLGFDVMFIVVLVVSGISRLRVC